MKSRGTGIMDALQPEAQMAEYWKEYFATVYKGAIKIWISVAAVCESAIKRYSLTDKIGRICFTRRHRNRPDSHHPTLAHNLSDPHPYRMPVHVRHGSRSRRFSKLQHESRDL